jgi:hypothetical protein
MGGRRGRALLAVLMACAAAGLSVPGMAQANGGSADPQDVTILEARYSDPNDRYDHDILGATPDWGGLEMRIDPCPACANRQTKWVRFRLPDTSVFEDITPILADLDGDGDAEVLVVETEIAKGARLVAYDQTGRIAATRPIGQTHRWLAPAGVADLDGDGLPEIAYVDRPHLKRDLVIVHLRDGHFTTGARLTGVTNHRIGDAHITGGVRNCGEGPELVLADAGWSRTIGVRLANGILIPQDLGPIGAMAARLACTK